MGFQQKVSSRHGTLSFIFHSKMSFMCTVCFAYMHICVTCISGACKGHLELELQMVTTGRVAAWHWTWGDRKSSQWPEQLGHVRSLCFCFGLLYKWNAMESSCLNFISLRYIKFTRASTSSSCLFSLSNNRALQAIDHSLWILLFDEYLVCVQALVTTDCFSTNLFFWLAPDKCFSEFLQGMYTSEEGESLTYPRSGGQQTFLWRAR